MGRELNKAVIMDSGCHELPVNWDKKTILSILHELVLEHEKYRDCVMLIDVYSSMAQKYGTTTNAVCNLFADLKHEYKRALQGDSEAGRQVPTIRSSEQLFIFFDEYMKLYDEYEGHDIVMCTDLAGGRESCQTPVYPAVGVKEEPRVCDVEEPEPLGHLVKEEPEDYEVEPEDYEVEPEDHEVEPDDYEVYRVKRIPPQERHLKEEPEEDRKYAGQLCDVPSSETSPAAASKPFTCITPQGLGSVEYYITDHRRLKAEPSCSNQCASLEYDFTFIDYSPPITDYSPPTTPQTVHVSHCSASGKSMEDQMESTEPTNVDDSSANWELAPLVELLAFAKGSLKALIFKPWTPKASSTTCDSMIEFPYSEDTSHATLSCNQSPGPIASRTRSRSQRGMGLSA